MFLRKFYTVPFIWNFLQSLIGSNSFKMSLFPSIFTKRGKILDFACSMGNCTSFFADFDYWGIDIDERAIIAATKVFKNFSNIHFVCADTLSETFEEVDFDFVLMSCVGHHLNDSQFEQTLVSLMARLKKGGSLHFLDPVSRPEKDNLITRFFIKHDQGRFVRTIEENKRMFGSYPIADFQIVDCPNRLIKLEDLLHIKILKE